MKKAFIIISFFFAMNWNYCFASPDSQKNQEGIHLSKMDNHHIETSFYRGESSSVELKNLLPLIPFENDFSFFAVSKWQFIPVCLKLIHYLHIQSQTKINFFFLLI
jgi:hypothetical protein